MAECDRRKADDSLFPFANSPAMQGPELSYDEWRQARVDRLDAAIQLMGWTRDRFREELRQETGVIVGDALWESWWKPSHKRFPNDQIFAKIAEFLGLSLDWFSGVKRWNRDVINPNRAFAAAILNRARVHPEQFPDNPFDIAEPRKKAA